MQPVYDSGGITLYQGNCLDVLPTLPERSVQACITSPPYWSLRDYGIDGQLGLERVPDCLGWATKQPCGECYVCKTVAWAREVRRVLRDDGIMWLVIGDSYAGPKGNNKSGLAAAKEKEDGRRRNPENWCTVREDMHFAEAHKAHVPDGLKPKDLVGIPWRMALALQADGWWLRSDVIWAKPNPMPESVTDRPTKAHEYVFLLAKSARYYWDAEAVKEAVSLSTIERWHTDSPIRKNPSPQGFNVGSVSGESCFGANGSRNLRTVWSIATQPYAGAHFAVFPERLIEPMVRASTSERGCCPKCGKAWVRVVNRIGVPRNVFPSSTNRRPPSAVNNAATANGGMSNGSPIVTTLGWQPTCTCGTIATDLPIIDGVIPYEWPDPIPCTILDPFGGSGTTAAVALRLGRRAILCELNPAYIKLQLERIGNVQPQLEGFFT